MIKQLAIIFGSFAVGELIVWFTDIKFPSSIIGMLLLTALLKLKVIKLSWVKGVADFLVKNIGFFFIPPGVALMMYFDVLKTSWLPIVVATIVSTILVMWSTGWIHQSIRKWQNYIKRHK